jgi:hypothetical protein
MEELMSNKPEQKTRLNKCDICKVMVKHLSIHNKSKKHKDKILKSSSKYNLLDFDLIKPEKKNIEMELNDLKARIEKIIKLI